MTTSPPGRPRDTRLDDAVLATFAALLHEQGYPEISLEQVARRAGVGKPALYRRWRNKAALAVDCLATIVDLDPVPDTGSLSGDLEAAWERLHTLWQQPRAGQNIAGLLVDLQHDPEAATLFRARIQQPRSQSVQRMVDRAVDRGELADADHGRFAVALLEGALVQWDLFNPEQDFPPKYSAFALRAVLRALDLETS